MFVIDLKYKANLEIIDQYLAEHRSWLDSKYQAGLLLCSGPKNPRDGGFIIAFGHDRADIEELIKEDPFYINNVVEYSITEFNPVKFHDSIKDLV